MKRRTRVIVTLCFVTWSYTLASARRPHHRHGLGPDCSKCAPGFGVVQRCGHGRDTECAPCRPGTYSPHHSYKLPCYPCSMCGVGLYVAHACTVTRDTICDSCHTYRGPHNRNFYLRCLLRTNSSELSSSERVLSNELLVKSPPKHRDSVHSTPNSGALDDLPESQRNTSADLTVRMPDRGVSRNEGIFEKVPKTSSVPGLERHSQREALVAGILATCAIVGLVVTAIVSWSYSSRHRKVRPEYPYQAVRTREAVML